MFSYQNTVTEQQTVHAEGNQYTCDVYKKSFIFSTSFKIHWRTRKQESQYTCNVCHKSFYDKSNLKKHQKYFKTMTSQCLEL